MFSLELLFKVKEIHLAQTGCPHLTASSPFLTLFNDESPHIVFFLSVSYLCSFYFYFYLFFHVQFCPSLPPPPPTLTPALLLHP